MLEPHHRAALIPNEPGQNWYSFIRSRFAEAVQSVGKEPSLAIVIQTIEQQSPALATIRGLVELSFGASLPVVADFVGMLNLETRELSIQQTHLEKAYTGQFSENGRVMVLHQAGQAKATNLVHEETLAQLV